MKRCLHFRWKVLQTSEGFKIMKNWKCSCRFFVINIMRLREHHVHLATVAAGLDVQDRRSVGPSTTVVQTRFDLLADES